MKHRYPVSLRLEVLQTRACQLAYCMGWGLKLQT